MTSLTKSALSTRVYTGAFYLILLIVACAAGAVIAFEAIKLHQFNPAISTTTAVTFALMLASLSGAVLSVILPARWGKVLLAASAAVFFAAVTLALIYGIRD